MAVNNTTSLMGYGSIENILFGLQTAIIITLLVVLARIVLVRFLGALMSRGRISAATKATLTRLIDIITIFTVIIAFLEFFVSVQLLIITIAVFILISFLLFYYELREFVAYINLQLLRHLHGRNYEIKLPHHESPIYGRIVAIEPLTSIIEDIYGRRIYVSNTMLVNSVMKEYIPSIQLRVKLSYSNDDPMNVIKNITSSFKMLELGIFRIDEKKLIIEKISGDEIVARINAYPTSLPIRLTDLVKLANSINKSLSKYNPVIEFVDTSYK